MRSVIIATLLLCLSGHLTPSCLGIELKVTSWKGVETVVRDVEPTGIRFSDSLGEVTPRWDAIKGIVFQKSRTEIGTVMINSVRKIEVIRGTVYGVDGGKRKATIPSWDYERQVIRGHTVTGMFQINIPAVRTIQNITPQDEAKSKVGANSNEAFGSKQLADVKVTTWSGSIRIIRDAYFDYAIGSARDIVYIRDGRIMNKGVHGVLIDLDGQRKIFPFDQIRGLAFRNEPNPKSKYSEPNRFEGLLYLPDGTNFPVSAGRYLCGKIKWGTIRCNVGTLKTIVPFSEKEESPTAPLPLRSPE